MLRQLKVVASRNLTSIGSWQSFSSRTIQYMAEHSHKRSKKERRTGELGQKRQKLRKNFIEMGQTGAGISREDEIDMELNNEFTNKWGEYLCEWKHNSANSKLEIS